jgi:hypothetical protein
MSGGARLGFGYTFLVLGVVMLLFVFVVSDMRVRTGENCEAGAGSADCGQYEITGIDGLFYIPGVILVLASIPLIVFGHTAARRAREATETRVVREEPVVVNETVQIEGEGSAMGSSGTLPVRTERTTQAMARTERDRERERRESRMGG